MISQQLQRWLCEADTTGALREPCNLVSRGCRTGGNAATEVLLGVDANHDRKSVEGCLQTCVDQELNRIYMMIYSHQIQMIRMTVR